jgi:hypothetical protein
VIGDRFSRPFARASRFVALCLALALAGVTACKPLPSPPDVPQGFDACTAPPISTMQTWWTSSPFTSVGVYIGGANPFCAQPNLTPSWVSTVTGQGWKLLPVWFGPQAPCETRADHTKLPTDPFWALVTGISEAAAAADRADALGFTWLAPVYYDMEAYPRGGECTTVVQAFTEGWVYQLNRRGYQAGFYGSLCSGIVDQVARLSTARYVPQAIWIASWNNTPNIYGFGAEPCPLPDDLWNNHQRVHQYRGAHDETWGGVTINIDSNAVDGPTFPLSPR